MSAPAYFARLRMMAQHHGNDAVNIYLWLNQLAEASRPEKFA